MQYIIYTVEDGIKYYLQSALITEDYSNSKADAYVWDCSQSGSLEYLESMVEEAQAQFADVLLIEKL